MDLHTYMRQEGLTDTEMAEKTGFSPSSIGKWRRLERFPRPKQMQRIQAATDGAVGPADFYEIQAQGSVPSPADPPPQLAGGAEGADPSGHGQPGRPATGQGGELAGQPARELEQGVG